MLGGPYFRSSSNTLSSSCALNLGVVMAFKVASLGVTYYPLFVLLTLLMIYTISLNYLGAN